MIKLALRFAIIVALYQLAQFPAASHCAEATLVGDSAVLGHLRTLHTAAASHFPSGRLVARVHTENILSNGVIDADVVATWVPGATRVEAKVEDRREGGVDHDTVFIQSGSDALEYVESARFAVLDRRSQNRARGYLDCMPSQCWYGKTEGIDRDWSWYLSNPTLKGNQVREVRIKTEGDIVTYDLSVHDAAGLQASLLAAFDLSLGGMCTSYDSQQNGLRTKATYSWDLDDQRRPILKDLEWRTDVRELNQYRLFSVSISGFQPEFVPDPSQFVIQTSKLPPGTEVLDQRSTPSRTFRVGSDAETRQQVLKQLGEELGSKGFGAEKDSR